MTPQIAHGAVAKIPPAIPFRPGKIDGMKWPRRRRPKPKIPVKPSGHWLRFLLPFRHPHDVAVPLRIGLALPAPRARNPDMSFGDGTDRAALHEFDYAMIVFI